MDLNILYLHTVLYILSFRFLMIIHIMIFCHQYDSEMPPNMAGIQDIGLSATKRVQKREIVKECNYFMARAAFLPGLLSE